MGLVTQTIRCCQGLLPQEAKAKERNSVPGLGDRVFSQKTICGGLVLPFDILYRACFKGGRNHFSVSDDNFQCFAGETVRNVFTFV
jgi:hypothetical protein